MPIASPETRRSGRLDGREHTILHLTGMKSTKYGGLEHYLIDLIELCNRRGYRSVLQYESPPRSTAYVSDLENRGAATVSMVTHGGPLHCVVGLAGLLRSVRPQIIQTHFVNKAVLFVTPIAGKILGARKIVSMVHNVHRSQRRPLWRFAYNAYDHVLAVSDAVAEDLMRGGVRENLISRHYLGLSGTRKRANELRRRFRYEFGIPEEAIAVACIAFDAPFKGLDVLLDAFKQVAGRSDVHLIVIGVDPAKSALPAQAGRLGLTKRVHWAGVRDEGWKILNSADFYVQPSRFGEGLPFAIMEAMAMHLPVVATRVAGNPEAVVDGETGYLTEPRDADSLARAIERMIEDRSRWEAMGDSGYSRFMQLFDAERSVKYLVEKYYGIS